MKRCRKVHKKMADTLCLPSFCGCAGFFRFNGVKTKKSILPGRMDHFFYKKA